MNSNISTINSLSPPISSEMNRNSYMNSWISYKKDRKIKKMQNWTRSREKFIFDTRCCHLRLNCSNYNPRAEITYREIRSCICETDVNITRHIGILCTSKLSLLIELIIVCHSGCSSDFMHIFTPEIIYCQQICIPILYRYVCNYRRYEFEEWWFFCRFELLELKKKSSPAIWAITNFEKLRIQMFQRFFFFFSTV